MSQSSSVCSTLVIKAVRFFETSGIAFATTQRQVPENYSVRASRFMPIWIPFVP
jgi:hypothetical protein